MKRQVALIVETSTVYGRNLLSGIVRFMRLRSEWSVFLEQRDLWKQPPSWLNDWHGDGIISRATTPKLVESISRTGVPLVEVTDRHSDLGLPQVRSDDAAIGRLGAEHLLERGFRKFGFCGYRAEAWSARREEAFADVVEAETRESCRLYNSAWHGPSRQSWENEQAKLIDWLKEFEPPFAVMACNDIRAQNVLDACLKLELSVPEQVAVLGVDNDELLCNICSPPLSSVVPSAEAVGYRAAEVLSEMMDGNDVAMTTELIEPLDVAVRQSTDVVAIDDRDLAAALRYIRENACDGISVDDVVRQSSLSRSTLERQVRRYLGRTPQEEIRHVQVKRVKELLLSTELPAETIAGICGFRNPEYLHVVFKRVTGKTTREFRQGLRP